MTATRKFAKVLTLVAATVFIGAVLMLFSVLPGANISAQSAQSTLAQSSLTRLTTASTPQERLQAAKWLGQQQYLVSADVVVSMGQCLRTDTDPAVRAAVAASFGELAAKQNAT